MIHPNSNFRVSQVLTRTYTVLTELRCNGAATGSPKLHSEAKQQDFPYLAFQLIMFKNKYVKFSSASGN